MLDIIGVIRRMYYVGSYEYLWNDGWFGYPLKNCYFLSVLSVDALFDCQTPTCVNMHLILCCKKWENNMILNTSIIFD
jgi:hypothetical protein